MTISLKIVEKPGEMVFKPGWVGVMQRNTGTWSKPPQANLIQRLG